MTSFEEYTNNILKAAKIYKETFRIIQSDSRNQEDTNDEIQKQQDNSSKINTICPTLDSITNSILNGITVSNPTTTDILLNKTCEAINGSLKAGYLVKEVSDLTGIEDWKIRRYISNGILSANDEIPPCINGKTFLIISKRSLLTFIELRKTEIIGTKKFKEKIEQIIKERKEFISNFLSQVEILINLGENEIKLDNHNKTNEENTNTVSFLQLLKLEKEYFTKQKKKLEIEEINTTC